MVDVTRKRCGHDGCTKQPRYGKVGENAEACAEHTGDGMVDVVSKGYGHDRCTKRPSHGKVEGKAEAVYVQQEVQSTHVQYECFERQGWGQGGALR